MMKQLRDIFATLNAIIWLLLLIPEALGAANTNEDPPGATCGYGSCPSIKQDKINIHILAHTHDDVGWLKTVDQYYYGTNKRHNPVAVEYILDSLIPELAMDENKRFVYVEISFFSKWWEEQDERTRQTVRKLVNEGRLEFINGGWCMNDEAIVNYQSTIEQMTLGLRFLNDTFGACARPKVGWQIDPFGHSNEQASLFAQFGFDGMFFTRLGHLDKAQRTANKSLDLIWHGDRALGGQSGSIFTNIFRDGYDTLAHFCFDVQCYDDNLVDNKRSHEYNIERKGDVFINYLREYAKVKLVNQVMIPLGGDFHYSAAAHNFKNSDKLIKYIQRVAPDLNIFYSTPSCYQQAVFQTTQERAIQLPEKYDDFMPYDSTASIWWSGYFTSRPSSKLVERETANLLQVARLASLGELLKKGQPNRWSEEVREQETKCLGPLWEVLGDLQHHDAITGTEKQHVNDDYNRRASEATNRCAKYLGDSLRATPRVVPEDTVYLGETTFCASLNISQCDPLESDLDTSRLQLLRNVSLEQTKSILLTVYNPLARPVSQHDIRLPCKGRCNLNQVRVTHLATNETQELIKLPLPAGLGQLPFRSSVTRYEILFYTSQPIPPLGFARFIIEDFNQSEDESSGTDDTLSGRAQPEVQRDVVEFVPRQKLIKRHNTRSLTTETSRRRLHGRGIATTSGPQLVVKFNLDSGMIEGVRRAGEEASLVNLTQKFGFYYPAKSGPQPGAYIFRSNTSEPYLLDKPIWYKIHKRRQGSLVEIHQKWADWLWQTIRVDALKEYIEFDYLIGPIPVEGVHQSGGANQLIGREVVTRYISGLANNGLFMTDSNGRQMLTRQRIRSDSPVETGGNFYPVVSTIMLRSTGNLTGSDKTTTRARNETLAVLVDRAQAGASLGEGQLELLVHRRHMRDDEWGVGEALNEPGEDGRGLVTRGKHRVYLKFASSENQQVSSGARDSKQRLIKLPKTPKANMTYEEKFFRHKVGLNKSAPVASADLYESAPTYLVHDQVLNQLKEESIRYALKPILTFDRLSLSGSEVAKEFNKAGTSDFSLLNATLPAKVHLLTLQPWPSSKQNEILLRLENLDNPLTLHPFPDPLGYQNLVKFYGGEGQSEPASDRCDHRRQVEVDVEYLIKRIRFNKLEELTLGANVPLKDDKRLDWTNERDCETPVTSTKKSTNFKLGPRQIRTFLAQFEYI